MIFENNIVKGNTIEDCWRNVLWLCVRNGYDYKIEVGSYEGQIRRQLNYLVIIIDEPWTRPLAVRVPEGLGIAPPTNEEKIEEYFMNYLITSYKTENEDYTYGEYIEEQIGAIIEKLKLSNGNTNQATITIGDENSITLNDPPCLKVVDFKVVDRKLNMNIYMRSFDLFNGFPQNIGGFQLLKEYVLTYLDNIEDGKIIAYSSGAHIYSMYFDIVNQLNVDQINKE